MNRAQASYPASSTIAAPADEIHHANLIARGRQVLEIEAQAVLRLRDSIGHEFAQACALILACQGRVVVSGMGKSGHIGGKIAATLASTGTPAFFLHPAEASHGDLGMVTEADVFLALSNSGTTEELLRIVPLIKRQGTVLIAMTGNPQSALAQRADVHLDARVEREACSLNLAPTASTTASLALGDALAVALLEARGFGPEDFARSHPGGALGRKLLTRVSDVMRTGEALPRVAVTADLTEAILEITRKRMGMTAVEYPDGTLAGVFTDGDLRRMLEHGRSIDGRTLAEVMTRAPVTIEESALAAEAVRRMEERRISALLVVDATGRLSGALHLHDLLLARVV